MFTSKRVVFLIVFTLVAMPAAAADISAERFLVRINDELLIEPLRLAIDSLDQQEISIRRYIESSSQADLASARKSFADLVYQWKRAQALYLAGALDEDLIDHPQVIDHYHQGRESIEQALRRILQTNDDLQQAMFKSSTKSINALEFLLYADIADNQRRWQAALIANRFIREQLAEVLEFYRVGSGFTQLDLAGLEMIINALVDSSYRLANWRLAEAAGLDDRYRDQPSAGRLEYARSGLSLDAVTAILETHARVFAIGAETGYLSSTGRAQGLDEMRFTVERIEAALQAARALAGSGRVDVSSSGFAGLVKRAQDLHKAYYFLLVEAMNLQGKIVDADGD